MFIFKKFASILIGSFMLSVGINFFLIPFKVLDGGMIGLGLIVKYVTGLQVGLVIICLSIPIFIIAWVYNRDYFYNSLHGMLFSSFAIDYIGPLHYPLIENLNLNAMVSSIIGGVCIGIGIGMMLRYKTSTGGTDLLAQLLSKVVPINVGILIFLMDAAIILLGGLFISTETLVLSAITIFVVGIFTSLFTWNLVEE